MEFRYILLLHALCLMMTVGVAWMSYAFAAIEDTVEQRDDVFSILLGILSAFIFAGAGTALIWATRDRRDMVLALIMMLVMIIIMHLMVRLAALILNKSSRLMLYTLLGSFTLVMYCIISLIVFSPSDNPVFKTFRAIQNNTTGQLPIDDWPAKRDAVLKALSDEMRDHNQAFQAAALALKGLSKLPEYRQVLDICKDAVAVMDDEKAQVRALNKVLDALLPVAPSRLKWLWPFGNKQPDNQPTEEAPPPPPQGPPVMPARVGNQPTDIAQNDPSGIPIKEVSEFGGDDDEVDDQHTPNNSEMSVSGGEKQERNTSSQTQPEPAQNLQRTRSGDNQPRNEVAAPIEWPKNEGLARSENAAQGRDRPASQGKNRQGVPSLIDPSTGEPAQKLQRTRSGNSRPPNWQRDPIEWPKIERSESAEQGQANTNRPASAR